VGSSALPGQKRNAVLEAEDGGAGASELHGFVGEIDRGDLRAGADEVDSISSDAAADFEDFLAAPAFELHEAGEVVFDEVFSGSNWSKYSFVPIGPVK
jgi:hypothetical protein